MRSKRGFTMSFQVLAVMILLVVGLIILYGLYAHFAGQGAILFEDKVLGALE